MSRRTPCALAAPARRTRGLGAVAVIVVLVGLAAMAAAVLRLGQQAQTLSTQDVTGARASAAARSGIEWGLYQAFKGAWTACSDSSQTLDLGADSAGLRVTVHCDLRSFNEGETSTGAVRTVRLYTIDAVACTSSTSCPDASAAVGSTYVERRRQVQAEN